MRKNSQNIGLQLLIQTNNTLKIPTWEVGYKSKTFRRELTDLKNVAVVRGLCSLSTNQIGHLSSFFVILARNRIVEGKWSGYKASAGDYEVVVNPKIEKRSENEFMGQ
jgi:peptide deformylase